MTVRCTPDIMKFFMAAWSVHSERVQNVFRASRNTLTARLPSARRACSADRNDAIENAGRYLHDLTRRRVIETCGMNTPRQLARKYSTPMEVALRNSRSVRFVVRRQSQSAV